MIKSIVSIAAALLICVSISQGGDVFSFSFETEFSKQQIPPNTPGNWLFLGCDSIIPVNVSLINSGDQEYPYKIKIGRKLPKPDSVCDRGENMIIRNIKGVFPGKFLIAMEDSINDSTKSYDTSRDTVRIIKTLANDGIALSFISGSQKQVVRNETYENVYIIFSGDINRDNRIDFVIRWSNTYANQYDVFISRIDNGIWQLKKEAVIVYSD